jgi:hypothetical protein
MINIDKYELYGRPMRVEGIDELGENTIKKLKQAVKAGNTQLALDIADYLSWEGKNLHDSMTDWIFCDLDWIARNCGEEKIPEVLRFVRQKKGTPYKSKGNSTWNALSQVRMYAEGMRGHRSGPDEAGDLMITEEPDRFVMSFDPCGSGGRMARGPLDKSGSRVEPPFSLGKTSKPYPWSWNKANVPYYCIHCCLWSEIMSIESNGYPLRVTECPVGDFNKPCLWYVYKSPELIPAEYFERVGLKKDPSRFKK